MSAHEDLSRRHSIKEASDRSFALVVAAVFLAVALTPLRSGSEVRWWSIAVSAILAGLAMVRPSLVRPAKRLFDRFGLMMGVLISSMVLAVLFYLVVTPTGLILRAIGRDLLRLRRDPNAGSYWIARDPPGPPPNTMSNQF